MFEEYKAAVHAWVESILQGYLPTDGSAHQQQRLSGKEMNDAVWGTITIDAFEHGVLDSPIVQRLRRVRQLGVAHWVYPAAYHTRHDHSLGVMHVAGEMMRGLRNVPEDLQRVVRLAALLHDIGHGALSHVSERALYGLRDVETIVLEANAELGTEDLRLGEIASFVIVAAPAFATMINALEEQARVHPRLPASWAEEIGLAVTGRPMRQDWPFIHQLVSGPFDADKLDYIARDALFCGLPGVVDRLRLLHKLRAVEVDPEELPVSLAASLPEGRRVWATGVAATGDRSIDEIAVARALLQDKVYRHQKGRAAEATIGQLYNRLLATGIAPLDLAVGTLSLPDDYVLDPRTLATHFGIPEIADDDIVDALCSALRSRELPVRACSFQSRMPRDPYRDEESHRAGLARLQGQLDKASVRAATEREIAAEATKLLTELGRARQVKPWEVSLDPPRPGNTSGLDAALLIHAGGEIRLFGEEAPETRGWTSAYTQTRDVGYLFAPRDVAVEVGLAARKLFRHEYRIRLPLAQVGGGTIRKDDVKAVQQRLADTDYYTLTDPADLRPVPARLQRADVGRRLDAIVNRLAAYQGVDGDPAAVKQKFITRQRIRDWISQFDAWFPGGGNDLLESVLTMLERFVLLTAHDFARTVGSAVAEMPLLADASVVPFGAPKDSSNFMAYASKVIRARYSALEIASLGEALKRGKPILFVDDFIITGRQGRGIVGSWFGDHGIADDLKEKREELVPELQELLRRHPVAFAVAAGEQAGVDAIMAEAGAHGMQVIGHHLNRDDAAIPRAFASPGTERLQECCREVGRWLVEEGRNPSERELGYGNRGYLIAHLANTPTQTLTCIWKGRATEDRIWLPLLPRQSKS